MGNFAGPLDNAWGEKLLKDLAELVEDFNQFAAEIIRRDMHSLVYMDPDYMKKLSDEELGKEIREAFDYRPEHTIFFLRREGDGVIGGLEGQ